MGLVDGLLGAALGGNSNSGGIQGALLNAVLKQVLGGNQSGAGGLAGMVGSMLGGGQQQSGGLGGLLGGLLGGGQQQAGAGGLAGMLGGLLGGGQAQEASTQVAGGLGGLTDLLSKAGLGEQVQSWIGTGENQPVSAEQIQASLGQTGTLGQIAQDAGVSEQEAAGGLADLLPGLINKLTPNGQINAGDIASVLGSLLGGNK
jgi:uncharacterized protein YidB (DUF937 family)